MRVLHKGNTNTGADFYPDQYEFKLCGGSVEPQDRVDVRKEARSQAMSLEKRN